MIGTESILRFTCPECGAGPGAPCVIGIRGKVRKLCHPRRIGRAFGEARTAAPVCNIAQMRVHDFTKAARDGDEAA